MTKEVTLLDRAGAELRAAETLLPKCENSCDYNVVARCLAKAVELCIKWQMGKAGVRHFPDDDITVLIRRCERCGLPLRLTYVIAEECGTLSKWQEGRTFADWDEVERMLPEVIVCLGLCCSKSVSVVE